MQIVFDHEIFNTELGKAVFSAGGLAIKGIGSEDAATSNTIQYAIGGAMYTKAAITTVDLSTAMGTLTVADGASAVVTCALNAAGDVLLYVDASELPDTEVGFGDITITNGSGADFTIGTTPLDTADVTVVYRDVHRLV